MDSEIIEQLCKEFLPNAFELSTFKPREVIMLEMAFIQGANVMMNYIKNNNSNGENWEQKCRELQKHNSELWEAFGNFCQAVNDQFNKNIQFMPPPIQQK